MIQKITLSMLLFAGLTINQAGAQMKLQATSKANNTGSVSDSVKYFHSGAKGYGTPKYLRVPEFELMEDSSHIFSAGVLTKKTVSTYTGTDFNQKITQTLNSGNWRNSGRTRIVYKSNKPDTVYYDTWSTMGSGSWRLGSCIVYTWSADNVASATRLTRSFGRNPKWENDWKTSYGYSGGNISDSAHQEWTSGAWTNKERKKYTWTAGKLTQVDLDGGTGTTWTPFYRATYTYDGNGRVILIDNKASNGSGGWKNFQRDTIMYNAGNTTSAPDTLLRVDASTGNFVNQYQLGFEYMPNGLVTKRTSLQWDGVSKFIHGGQDSVLRWYWDYNVSVEKLDGKGYVLNVYPSPASNTINIAIQGGDSRQVQYAIVDMQGRVVKNWNEAAQAVSTVSIAELPAGNYMLHINDGSQTATRKFSVVK